MPIADAFAHLCLSSQFQPAVQGKVDTLGAIESEVKTGVVATGKCYHKLAFALNKKIWFAR